MEFKSYTEIVLPPERGTGIRKRVPKKAGVSGGDERDRVESEAPTDVAAEGSIVVLTDREKAILEGDRSDPENEKSARGKARRESEARHPESHQTFLFAYDGKFLGHFTSHKRITNRTAFQRIAARLLETRQDFDPKKLQLFRPVPIKIESPEAIAQELDGAFKWFSEESETLYWEGLVASTLEGIGS